METFLMELSLIMTNSFVRVDGYHEEAIKQLEQLFSIVKPVPKTCETIIEVDEDDEKENQVDSNRFDSTVSKTTQKKDIQETVTDNSFFSRPRRTAALNAFENMKKQREFKSTTNLRQSSDYNLKQVKAEKQSIAPNNDVKRETELVPSPPQTKAAKTQRKRTRSTYKTNESISTTQEDSSPKPKASKRTKTSKRTKSKRATKNENETVNSSTALIDEPDVEIVSTVHPMVSLSDTENEKSCHSFTEKSINEASEKNLKILASTCNNESHIESDKTVNEHRTFVFNLNKHDEETYVVQSATNEEENFNTTFTLPKPMPMDNLKPISDCASPINGIISDFRDEKLLFSPLDPVKKRIEAIEKLTNSCDHISSVPRVSRLQETQTMTAAIQKEEERMHSIPTNIATDITKIGRVKKTKNFDQQNQRQEEQRKKITKEEEAKQKRDALIRAKVEEQRKRSEEKRLRAQQQREEKERLRRDRYERREQEKDEEKKRLLAEREEASRKELLRKKAISEKRVLETEERRKAEEAARLQRLLEQEEAKKQADAQRKKEQEEAEILHQRKMQEDEYRNKMKAQAIEMLGSAKKKTLSTPGSSYTDSKLKNKPTSKIAPYLKTNKLIIDFDSDSDSDHVPKVKAPWKVDSHFLRYQNAVPSSVKHNLYSGSSKLLVINLKEVFPKLNTERLGRNSSAVWKTPPRYSMLNCSTTQL